MLMTLNKKSLRTVACLTLLLMFCAHAFCYANLSFSGASVMVDVSRGDNALTADGQFLATLYWRVRGSLSSPMTVGLLSAAYLTGCAVLIADLFGLAHTLSLLVLSGVLTLHVSVTAINASMLHMADLYFLSLLFAAAGAWLCLRHKLGFLPAAACFTACLGLQPSLLAAGPALALMVCILRVLHGESVRAQMVTLAKALLALIAGFAVYLAGAWLFARRRGVSLAASWLPMGDGLIGTWLAPFRALFTPATAYAALCATLYALLLVLAVCALLAQLRGLSAASKAFAVIGALALPLVIAMPIFCENAPTATCERLALCMLPIAMAALLDLFCGALAARPARIARGVVACAFGVTFLSSVVFTNQVYLKKNLEYQTTLSAMTRVVEQAEQTEGFTPGTTPVAIVGTLEDSGIAMAHKGFEHLAVLDAAANNYTASSQEQNTWYFWEILGYPFNFVSDVDRDALAVTDTVAAMPAFPQSGYCAMVDGTLVIKLSQVH